MDKKNLNVATEVLDQLNAANKAQSDLILKIQTRKKYEMEGFATIDFVSNELLEYTDGVLIRDLTTDEQAMIGVNIFNVKINKTVSSWLHRHNDQLQLVYIKKGEVFNETSGDKYVEGDNLLVSRNNEHSFKYLKNSELIVIFIPGLKEV